MGQCILYSRPISQQCLLDGAQFRGEASFDESQFYKAVTFRKVRLSEESDFKGAMLAGHALFVNETRFSSEILSFKGTTFGDPKSQEDACRKAKNVMLKIGKRDEESYYFYREMDAKRKQKPPYLRYPEWLFIQIILGYGVYPRRIIISWTMIVAVFAISYYVGNGINVTMPNGIAKPLELIDCVKVSFSAAITAGYIVTIINPANIGYKFFPEYQAAAMVETILGIFLWTGFIATFARKYMK